MSFFFVGFLQFVLLFLSVPILAHMNVLDYIHFSSLVFYIKMIKILLQVCFSLSSFDEIFQKFGKVVNCVFCVLFVLNNIYSGF